MYIIPVVDLHIVRGDDKLIQLQFTKDDLPIDITGWTVFFTIKQTTDKIADDSSAVLKQDITSHINPTQGITQILIDHVETAKYESSYIYDIQTKDTFGKITTVVIGQILVELDITRRTV